VKVDFIVKFRNMVFVFQAATSENSQIKACDGGKTYGRKKFASRNEHFIEVA